LQWANGGTINKMSGATGDSRLAGLGRQTLEHVLRTTAAATVSLALARAVGFPQPQWAAISTMVVTQSTLGAAMTISSQRFAGTALGATAGALLASYVHPSMLAFTVGVFGLGLVCGLLHLDRAAYRFAGITLAIVVLAAMDRSAWIIGADRFFEVSLGIAAGLGMTAVWPEGKRSAKPAATGGPR
jgi:uncharacterized membrane protein YccC